MVAGSVMALVVWRFDNLFIAIPVFLGVVSYLTVVLLLRIIPKEDFTFLQSLIQPFLNKVRRPQPEAVRS
jgi:hypothetical protein